MVVHLVGDLVVVEPEAGSMRKGGYLYKMEDFVKEWYYIDEYLQSKNDKHCEDKEEITLFK